MSNKLTQMAREILAIEADILNRFDYTVDNPKIDDFDIHIFEQVWGSTALGFGGIGGDVMTSATTYVLVPYGKQDCFVYFAGRYAYSAPYSEKFREDIHNKNMLPVYEAEQYRQCGDLIMNRKEKGKMEGKNAVRHGYWFFIEPGAVWCSECGLSSSLDDAPRTAETKRRIAEGEVPNYCQHCGAKMDLKSGKAEI